MLNKLEYENEGPAPSLLKKSNYVDDEGNVFILGEFDSSISQEVVPNLLKKIKLERNNPDPQIWFYINSNGGYVHELYNLLMLLDMAKSFGIKIYTVIMGRAYSCGSILAMHGDHRVIYKYGQHLMHLGRQGDDVSTFEQIERTNKRWGEHFENIVNMYKEHTKMPEKRIREVLKDDGYFLNAEECLKYGLVDEIAGAPRTDIPEVKVAEGDVIQIGDALVKVAWKESKPKKVKKSSTKSSKEKVKEKKHSKKTIDK